MTLKPRYRFAPSPTGYLHIGGARTALFNYLLSKKTKGTFILRIEDTDLERSTPESIQAILDGMKWLNLEFDEGPFYQTKRFDLYQKYVDQLVEKKLAYPCFCTVEELTIKRELAQKEKRKPKYDRTCWHLSDDHRAERIKSGVPFVIRFLSTDEGETVVDDLIKGEVRFNNAELDDLVLRRTDGSPTYNLTVVIDDALMNITHVIRGDDHLNNTPRQIQLYKALNFSQPHFAHVPMILGTDKKRLSKRHGATSVMAYKDLGYLSEALINYLVRLGWSFGDEEIFSMEDLIQKFSIENVSKSAGIFNPEKLLWINGVYMRQTETSKLAKLVIPFLNQKGIDNPDSNILMKAVKSCQEKVKTLVELADWIDFFFMDTKDDSEIIQKEITLQTKPILDLFYKKIKNLDSLNQQNLKILFDEMVESTQLKLGKIASPLRVALTGRKVSPGLFDTIEILGKEKVLARLQKYM